MRSRSRFACLAAVAAIAASPAQANHVPGHRQRIGGWDVIPLPPGGCAVRRDLGQGTLIRMTASEGRGTIEIRSPVLEESSNPGPYRISLVVDGERRPFPGEEVPGRSGLAMAFDPSSLRALTSASALDVHGLEGVLLKRFYLEGLEAALARQPACIAEAGGLSVSTAFPAPPAPPPPPPPPPSRGRQKAARAQANLASLFSSDDYPEAAWQAREEGPVGFRLRVDRTGRVAECRVTSSSGSTLLDETTCRLLAERARFTPARDSKGRPAEDSLSGRIVWRIPEPEPEPPPPPPL